MPSTPVRQWLALLEQELGAGAMGRLVREAAANPLERRNFLPEQARPPLCSDRRLLQARQLLEQRRSEPPRPLAATAAAEPAAAEAGFPAQTPAASASHAALLAWLQAPQEVWLESLGLRPREWGQQVQNLEPLSLEERERAQLLRQALARPSGSDTPDWLAEQRGRGNLPPGAAAVLEANQLSQRYSSLAQVLGQLGEERLDTAAAAGLEGELRWRGDQLVMAHTAKAGPAQRLELWLAMLLACAAGREPRRGVLVARDAHQFRIVESVLALPATEALAQLEQLQALKERYRGRCWPVPPRTGWAWAEAEWGKAGSGFKAAASTWEGGFGRSGEREQAAMGFCFGAGLGARDLVDEPFCQAALTLLEPLLERRSVDKAGGKGR